MNYLIWAQEYYTDAGNLKKVIESYEQRLKRGEYTNYESISSIISGYRNIYYEVLNTAKLLEARGKAQEEERKKEQEDAS